MASKLTSLIDHAQRNRAIAEQSQVQAQAQTTDIAAIVMAGQTAMADVITRNFSGEISAKVREEVGACMDGLAGRVEAAVMARVDSAIQSAIEGIKAPEIEPEEPEDDESPKVITVQRKDGLIASVKVGEKAYHVVRNKQGLIKEVRPSGM